MDLPLRSKVRVYSPPQVDRIWLRVCYDKTCIYLIVYLLKGDYRVKRFGFRVASPLFQLPIAFREEYVHRVYILPFHSHISKAVWPWRKNI